jgi:hypothetical protein
MKGDPLKDLPKQRTKEVSALSYEAFLTERSAKLSLLENQQKTLDTSLLTLAGGGLGLTLTFLHEKNAVFARPELATTGLILLIVSLCSVLISMFVSQEAISRYVDALDVWCEESFKASHEAAKEVLKRPLVGITKQLNYLAGGSFLIGVCFLSGFVLSNL